MGVPDAPDAALASWNEIDAQLAALAESGGARQAVNSTTLTPRMVTVLRFIRCLVAAGL